MSAHRTAGSLPATEKAALRARLGAERRARSSDELAQARAAVCRHVLEGSDARGWRCVAAYQPLRTEPGSVELLAGLHARGTRVLVPITLADRDLDWTEWPSERADAAPLMVGGEPDLGLDAIAQADLVLVPALAVALDGTRLGRGGGSFDRALRRRRASSLLAALVFATEILPALPKDPWDLPVDAAVTPDGWVALGGNTPGVFRG